MTKKIYYSDGTFVVIDQDLLIKAFTDAIKNDKKTYKRGVIRYEIVQKDHTKINCIDSKHFNDHLTRYTNQGFSVTRIENVRIGRIPAKMYVLGHQDRTKQFKNLDGLAVDYIKAGHEITFFEVIL
jgi:hypothetical protein